MQRSLPMFFFQDHEHDALRAMIAECPRSPGDDIEEFLEDAAILGCHGLPERLRRSLWRFGITGAPTGALVIRGWPCDPVCPPTPTTTALTDKPTHYSELWAAVCMPFLGQLVRYRRSPGIDFFQTVAPRQEMEDVGISSACSSVRLGFHTDNPEHPHPPDIVILSCLRADPAHEAQTRVVSIASLLGLLTKHQQNLAWERIFELRDAYGGTGEVTTVRIPLLYGHKDDPCLLLDLPQTVGVTHEAQHLLDALDAGLYDASSAIALEPGDMLLIDNRRAAHDRTPFAARYDGTDRWLQRCALVKDMQRCRRDWHSDGRVIGP